jgi:hypothetical protein
VKWSETEGSLYAKYLSSSYCNNPMEGKQQMWVKVSNINFHKIPAGERRVIRCGRPNGGITLLRVNFRNIFPKALYNISLEVLENFCFDILLSSEFTVLLQHYRIQCCWSPHVTAVWWSSSLDTFRCWYTHHNRKCESQHKHCISVQTEFSVQIALIGLGEMT